MPLRIILPVGQFTSTGTTPSNVEFSGERLDEGEAAKELTRGPTTTPIEVRWSLYKIAGVKPCLLHSVLRSRYAPAPLLARVERYESVQELREMHPELSRSGAYGPLSVRKSEAEAERAKP